MSITSPNKIEFSQHPNQSAGSLLTAWANWARTYIGGSLQTSAVSLKREATINGHLELLQNKT